LSVKKIRFSGIHIGRLDIDTSVENSQATIPLPRSVSKGARFEITLDIRRAANELQAVA
jgi:hypothetical protein